MPVGDEIGKDITIQDGEKRIACFNQHVGEATRRQNGTAIRRRVKALDKIEVRFHSSHHLAQSHPFGCLA